MLCNRLCDTIRSQHGWRMDVELNMRNRRLEVEKFRSGEGYLYLRFRDWSVMACYISPNRL